MNSDFNQDDLDRSNEEAVRKAKSKLVMDFGLKQARPEKVTIEVLQQFIKDKPDKMTTAVRRWLRRD